MASKKSGGTAKNLRDSGPQYLGIKLYGGERATPGNIIVRQRGTVIEPGVGVKLSKDHTIYAVREGKVTFRSMRKIRFDGKKKITKAVDVL
jgi:large subunit ribosomal protein L27